MEGIFILRSHLKKGRPVWTTQYFARASSIASWRKELSFLLPAAVAPWRWWKLLVWNLRWTFASPGILSVLLPVFLIIPVLHHPCGPLSPRVTQSHGLVRIERDLWRSFNPASPCQSSLQKASEAEKDIPGAEGRQGGYLPAPLTAHCFSRDQFWQQPEQPHQCPQEEGGILLTWSVSAFPGQGVTKEKIKGRF